MRQLAGAGAPRWVRLRGSHRLAHVPSWMNIGLKYGTSEIAQTTTLNRWKLRIIRSSRRRSTIVARTGCRMRSRPNEAEGVPRR